MIKSVNILRYKSFPLLEAHLKPLSVLIGPNDAGKSNFLDALQLLSRTATSRKLKDAFEPPYRGEPLESFSFGSGGIEELRTQESVSFIIEVDVVLSPAVIKAVDREINKTDGIKRSAKSKSRKAAFIREKYLRYGLKIEMLPQKAILSVTYEYLKALNLRGQPADNVAPFIEGGGGFLHLRSEGRSRSLTYPIHLDHSILSLPLYPPDFPHVIAMREELASWFFFYFEPRQRMRAPNAVKEVHHIGLMGEELAAYLNTLRARDEAQFKAVEKALRLLIPSVTGIDIRVNDWGQLSLRLLQGETPIPASVLSEGTLRMLGLLALASAKEPPSLIAFEEPENGIHPQRIRLVAELLKTLASSGNTQVIATTHSPILIDLIPKDFLYICRKIDGKTIIRPYSEWAGADLNQKREVEEALRDLDEEPLVSERILRGDFDG